MRSRAVTRSMSVLCVATLGLLTGCMGEDLAKANFERTTVKAEGSSDDGRAPSGPIDDAALDLAALRTVDACAVLTGDAVTGFTKNGEPRLSDWGSCHLEVTDAGGKEINVMLELGEASVFADQANGELDGLPLVETSVDEESCYSTAVTQRDPDMGISVLAMHDEGGGDPCGTSYVILRGVVQQLRAGAPSIDTEPGSLQDFDMCEAGDEKSLTAVFGESDVEGAPVGLHGCQYSLNSRVLHVRGRLGYPVSVDEGSKEVDLGAVTGVRKPGTTEVAECDLTWNHRTMSDSDAEVVRMSYYDYSEETDVAGACELVTGFAKSVVKALPSA